MHRGVVYALLAAVLFGASTPFSKILIGQVAPVTLAGLLYLGSGLGLLAWFIVRAMKPNGFNIGLNLGKAAGAGVLDHVHWHVVPRWDGDTNFMPVIADTHVVPQALDELYAELKKHL